ncbi:MAG: S-layer homology domain-containing protein, partial [Sedimentibacter sp.]
TLPVSGEKAYIYYYDEDINALIFMGGTMSSDKTSVTADITGPGTYIAVYNPTQVIFEDIASDYWGYHYIYGLNYLNTINGYNDSGKFYFKPEGKITRSEFIKLLVTSQNINISEASDLELKFADTDKIPSWAVPYIKAAVMRGLVNGKKIGEKIYFAPGDNITREEIASVIGRTVYSDKTSDKIFNDAGQVSSWAWDEIKKLVELGIINGYEDNTFRPKNNATRTEAAVMIYKILLQ